VFSGLPVASVRATTPAPVPIYLTTGNHFPWVPYPDSPWWAWALVGAFLVVWFLLYFARRRR